MPLQDHFRPPLSIRRHWHAFHNAWATYLSSHLNQRLPEGYFAEANVQFGIEIDVASFEEGSAHGPAPTEPSTGWTAPAPTQSVPISIVSDTVEILVFGREGSPTLAAAVELVSPANKDRPAHRDAFVSKCATFLQQGIGLLVVDVVTERGGNLHDELLARLRSPGRVPLDADLYAVAYRTVERSGQTALDIWQERLEVGRTLPTMPLWLRGGLCLPADLEATYERTCREQRVQVNGA
jgi:hypothetical protein